MKKLIIHMGAHRCGSTAIQNLLARSRAALERRGVGVVTRADMAADTLDMRRVHRFSARNPLWYVRLKRLAKHITTSPFEHIVVSEENLIGTMPGVLGTGFYPHFRALLSGLRTLGRLLDGECTIHPRLVVRRQDRFIESVYAFRVSRGLDADFTTFMKQVESRTISWLRLQQDLDALLPNVDNHFALLEAWSNDANSAQQVAAFLELPSSAAACIDETPRRFIGNARFSMDMLGVLLAANRAGFNAHKAFGGNQLLSSTADQTIEKVEQALDAKQRAFFRSALNAVQEAADLSFTAAARQAFLDQYQSENQQFFAHNSVGADASIWD